MKSGKRLSSLSESIKLPMVIIPLCLGVLLIVLAGMGGEREKEENKSSISELCSYVEGVGRCYAEVSYDSRGEIKAVAVMCQGADNTHVRSELYRLISSFYGIGYNRISVLKISE